MSREYGGSFGGKPEAGSGDKLVTSHQYGGRPRFDGRRERDITEGTPVDRYFERESVGNQLTKFEHKAEAAGDEELVEEIQGTLKGMDSQEQPDLAVLRGQAYVKANAVLAGLLSSYVADKSGPTHAQARVLTYVQGVLKVDPQATMAVKFDEQGSSQYSPGGKVLTQAHGYLSQDELDQLQSALFMEAAYEPNEKLLAKIAAEEHGELVRRAFEKSASASGLIFKPSHRKDLTDML